MAELILAKVVAFLPETLAANAIYAVRAGVGFDLYITDTTGAVAHQLNGYSHPNHTGAVTSTGDGATALGSFTLSALNTAISDADVVGAIPLGPFADGATADTYRIGSAAGGNLLIAHPNFGEVALLWGDSFRAAFNNYGLFQGAHAEIGWGDAEYGHPHHGVATRLRRPALGQIEAYVSSGGRADFLVKDLSATGNGVFARLELIDAAATTAPVIDVRAPAADNVNKIAVRAVTLGGANSTNYALYASAAGGSGDYGIYVAAGRAFFAGDVETNGGKLVGFGSSSFNGVPEESFGVLRISSKAAVYSANQGAEITFWGDTSAQGNGLRAIYAGVYGVKENGNYLDNKGALVFLTNPVVAGDNSLRTKADLVEAARISSAGNLLIGTAADNGTRLQVSGSGVFTGWTKSAPVLLSALASAASAGDGATANIIDGATTTPGEVATGSGSLKQRVRSDGTNWRVDSGPAAAASHTHGNLTNDGAIGSTSGLPIKTGASGVLEVGAFGTGSGQFAEGNHNHDAEYAPVLGPDDYYVTGDEKVLLGQTSGNNTGDQDLSGYVLTADIDTLAELNSIVTDATLIDTGDSRLSDARTPTAHAASHVNGADDIQSATASQKGLATAAQITKLNGIAAGANLYVHPNHSGAITSTGDGATALGSFTLSALNAAISDATVATGGGTATGTNTGDQDLSGYVQTAAIDTLAELNGIITDATLIDTGDPRLSDARTPTSHGHGNLSNVGAIGSTANLPVITGASGVLGAGTFGSTANTFCQGNDSRLSDARTPTAHASTHVTGGSDKIRDATAAQDGLMTAAHAAKLDGVAANANNYIHPNHTGDVTSTGDGATVINKTAISSRAYVAPLPDDEVLIGDYSDSGNLKRTNCSQIAQLAPLQIPIGAVLDWAGAAAPDNYLLCYGQAVSRTTYSILFGVLGTTYGAGDTSTTFNLPDLRGMVVAGKDNMGGSTREQITSAGSGINGTLLGANNSAANAQTHTLSLPQIPAHDHSYFRRQAASTTGTGSASRALGTSDALTTGSAGGGEAHNNMQPTLILNKIIRAL
jgi:microcystin-dependent protein